MLELLPGRPDHQRREPATAASHDVTGLEPIANKCLDRDRQRRWVSAERPRCWRHLASGRAIRGRNAGTGRLEASYQSQQIGGVVAGAAEALREALERSAHFRLAEEVHPEAELMVLRESSLG